MLVLVKLQPPSLLVLNVYRAVGLYPPPLLAGLPAKLLRYEIEEDKCETLHEVVRSGTDPRKLQHQTDPLKLENIYTLCKGESSKVGA